MNPLQMYTRALAGVHGASTFLAAVASGDVAPQPAVEARRAICRVCPRMVVKVAPGAVADSSWCGEPLQVTASTCGCLVAAKTLVASEKCPQNKW
jgi:hypothetical protein